MKIEKYNKIFVNKIIQKEEQLLNHNHIIFETNLIEKQNLLCN